MRIALDTNILVYAAGLNGLLRKNEALDLLERLPRESILLPVQTLGELFFVLVRKAKYSRTSARDTLLNWGDAFPVLETSASVLISAAELATTHQLVIWDAVILATAAQNGCRLLLSEDFQEGFTWNGTTVTNPFAPTKHALLAGLLRKPAQANRTYSAQTRADQR